MNRFTRLALASLAISLSLSMASCGDGLDLQPNLSGPAGSTAGGSRATPTPTATPVPATPTPTPNTGAGSCTLPTRPDCGNSGCCSEGGTRLFDGPIQDAQEQLQRTRPDIFNSTARSGWTNSSTPICSHGLFSR